VRDEGVGIDAEVLPRVFDLFAQADGSLARSQGGLGIGLTIVRSLVEMHGGTVEARSEGPGRGSEFVVRLPVARVAKPTARIDVPLARPSSRCRVLVVDDNVDSTHMLQMILNLEGHDTHVARDGNEALLVAAGVMPDVVILDIGLPGLSGYDVARELRARPEHAATFLIALTGYGQDDDRRRSAEAGFDVHLVKPVEPEMLRDLLAQFAASIQA